ncbi:Hypothetical_protein [Hexamita inflata]|uniref:Hypothetical_protein n=1 Tax=Hexamita inflata TaxID=28002 RepID=A0AA86UL55_9EUKA|nr:Hypothetical protein HINF_LOCUS43351 [Hexamita inflata]
MIQYCNLDQINNVGFYSQQYDLYAINPQDAYFEVLDISPGVELCFTDQCKTSLNSTGKFNITEMNFLVRSQSSGHLEFQVKIQGTEKKKNDQWIIWVVLAVVLVIVGIAVFVFFFMRYKKQMNKEKLQDDETEAFVGEK